MELEVRWGDMDALGHVNNAAYVWLSVTRTTHVVTHQPYLLSKKERTLLLVPLLERTF